MRLSSSAFDALQAVASKREHKHMATTLTITNLIRIAVIGLALAVPSSPQAQGYPERPVTLLIPYTAGGPTDISSRAASESV